MAANDTGPLRHRYGGMRDLVVGATVALSDGTLAPSGREGDQERRRLRPGQAVHGLARHARADRARRRAAAPAAGRRPRARSARATTPTGSATRPIALAAPSARGRLPRRRLARRRAAGCSCASAAARPRDQAAATVARMRAARPGGLRGGRGRRRAVDGPARAPARARASSRSPASRPTCRPCAARAARSSAGPRWGCSGSRCPRRPTRSRRRATSSCRARASLLDAPPELRADAWALPEAGALAADGAGQGAVRPRPHLPSRDLRGRHLNEHHRPAGPATAGERRPGTSSARPIPT